MTINMVDKVRPAHEYRYLESVKCDLCGKIDKEACEEESKNKWEMHSHKGGKAIEWGKEDVYDVTSTSVHIKEGELYHIDSGQLDYRCYHICPDCFKEKLEPWLKEHGAAPTLLEEYKG